MGPEDSFHLYGTRMSASTRQVNWRMLLNFVPMECMALSSGPEREEACKEQLLPTQGGTSQNQPNLD